MGRRERNTDADTERPGDCLEVRRSLRFGSLPPELGAHFSVFWPKLLAHCFRVWAGPNNVLKDLLPKAIC